MTSVAANTARQAITRPEHAYSVEIDTFGQHEWHSILNTFDDANLMQTWSYGKVRWGEAHLSHVTVKKHHEVIAAAQVVIKKIPFLRAGMAYVKGGPLWQPRGTETSLDTLRQVLRVLREEYAVRRRLLLRIFPADVEDGTETIRSVFEEEGFSRPCDNGAPGTALIDLSHSLEDLRKSLKPKWRRDLMLAEGNNDLHLSASSTTEAFDTFVGLYREMLSRKHIFGVVNIDLYKKIQRDLPESFKMRIMICQHGDEPVAGLVVPCIGNTAVYALAATGDKGLDLRASYLLHWRMLEWAKMAGFRWLNLDGINRRTYPGISHFKFGLSGKLGIETEYLGQFEAANNLVSKLSVKAAEQLRTAGTVLNRLRSGILRRTSRMKPRNGRV
jgi:lipid II:glycine glycyltransferase (peptidoglycan interpeptide bridge formation enzyme)